MKSLRIATAALTIVALASLGAVAAPPAAAGVGCSSGDAVDLYICNSYYSFLTRAPHTSEYPYWRSRVTTTASRAGFLRAVVASNEGRGVAITRYYQDVLGPGHPVDSGGMAFWKEQLRTGRRIERLEVALYGSGTFFTVFGGTNDAFVTQLYSHILERSPEGAAKAGWVSRLDEATYTRADVATAIINAHETANKRARFAFQCAFNRDPGTGEAAPLAAYLFNAGTWPSARIQLSSEQEAFDNSFAAVCLYPATYG